MVRVLSVLVLTALIALAAEPDDLRKRPITTDNTPVGKLLKQWYAEGTAAGNAGDWYDNRDGEHSPLNLGVWPQLQKVRYTDEEFKLKVNWAAQRRVLPHVTFGNSSTSAPPTAGGSNPRMYYTSPAGLQLLQAHYRRNNLYIYPEHRDHDPGRNGVGPKPGEEGWGDLYPTNTPYLIISQGSSGTDQPFMRAFPFTLAAFRPEVKKLLVDKGLLMPTLQRILRGTNKSLRGPDDYFTGKAHPSVFEGSNVDPLAMVKMAHGMTKETVPPLACVRVLEEDAPVNGKDFFDLPGRTEKLADTAHVMARVWRGSSPKRRVVLSAKDSEDVSGRPLTFRWVVLRGDEKRVTITPRGAGNVEAEVVLEHHPRRPAWPGAAIESNRVDIGVFADNGKAVSTPAFFTYLMLDDEDRSGRKITYGATTTESRVTDWGKLLTALAADAGAGEKPREALAIAATKVRRIQEELTEARARRQEAEKRRNGAGVRRVAAEKKAKADPADAAAAKEWDAAKAEQKVSDAAFRLADDGLKAAQNRLEAELDARDEALSGSARTYAQTRLTPGLPKDAVQFITRTNYVDPRLAAPKRWTDEYDVDGSWTRVEGGKKSRFTPEGWLVTKVDEMDRAVRAFTVTYRQDPPKGRVTFNPNPLRWEKGDEEITIDYEDGKRVIKGRVKVRESSP